MIRHRILAAIGIILSVIGFSHCDKPEKPEPNNQPAANLTGGAAAFAHTREILSYGPRPPQSAALRKTRAYLTARLREAGWQAGSQKFTAPTRAGQVEFTNLIARFGPADDPDLWSRPVTGVIGAHIDSKLMPPPKRFLGADDAASAAGLMLELARQLRDSPDQARRIELVFFDGEEAFAPQMTPGDGLFGSRKYATRWQTAAAKPKFGLILDMIGHKNLRVRYPSDSPAHLVALLNKAAAAESAADQFGSAPGPILDDHVPLNNAGIPTLDIIGDFPSTTWWHTERDNLDIISPDSLDLTLRIVTRMLGELAPTGE